MALTLLPGGVIGCRPPATAVSPTIPYVLMVPLRPYESNQIRLSGTVRARYETPIAFQVSGRVLDRRIDAGQRVEKDQLLFRLDPRDFDEAIRAAEAQLRSAQAALATAQTEYERQMRLMEANATSQERLDRAALAARDARSAVEAAEANLATARNNRGYTELHAPDAGIVLEVMAEPGQVVAVGHPVAVLAREGEREVEVDLPDGTEPPSAGRLMGHNGSPQRLELREVAGAADPRSRTWRARYRVLDDGDGRRLKPLVLGSVVTVVLDRTPATGTTGGLTPADLTDTSLGLYEVPLSAVDERGSGPRVWLVTEGRLKPHPVTVVAISPETARIRTDLPATTRVVAVGTHLLNEGQAVREKQR